MAFASPLFASSGSEEESTWITPILPHPAELIVGLICFFVLLWIIKRYVVPPLETVYAERVAAIEGGMAKAESAQAAADEALQSYQNQLANAQNEAHQIRERAKADATAAAEEIRAQAQADSQRITSAAQRQVEAEYQQAMVQLKSEVGKISVDLAGRIVGQELENKKKQDKLVDDFLRELEAEDAATAGKQGA